MKTVIAARLDSPARVSGTRTQRPALTVGLVQTRWHEDPDEHRRVQRDGIASAARAGAQIVFLPELTLSRYPADTLPGEFPARAAEDLLDGPTIAFARRAAAQLGVAVHASLYERADGADGLGYNTAILVSPDGELLGRTRKLHIPRTAGYHEHRYFRPGPSEDAYPVTVLRGPSAARLGMPTCWDEWFPEVARAYALAGAELLAYPTAIGSEPEHPGFDTQPLWRQVVSSPRVPASVGSPGACRVGPAPELCDS